MNSECVDDEGEIGEGPEGIQFGDLLSASDEMLLDESPSLDPNLTTVLYTMGVRVVRGVEGIGGVRVVKGTPPVQTRTPCRTLRWSHAPAGMQSSSSSSSSSRFKTFEK